jgi:hypothetical protein
MSRRPDADSGTFLPDCSRGGVHANRRPISFIIDYYHERRFFDTHWDSAVNHPAGPVECYGSSPVAPLFACPGTEWHRGDRF